MKSTLSHFSGKFRVKMNILKFRIKYMFYLGTFGLEFEKGIVIFRINILDIFYKQSIVRKKKKKKKNVGPKMSYLGVLDNDFENLF